MKRNLNSPISRDQEKAEEIPDTPKKDKSKEQVKTLYQSIVQYLEEYCDSSSIHGIRYMGEKRRSWTERYFFKYFSSFVICFSFFRFRLFYWLWLFLLLWIANLSPSFSRCSSVPSSFKFLLSYHKYPMRLCPFFDEFCNVFHTEKSPYFLINILGHD